jgi:hypothetical protein
MLNLKKIDMNRTALVSTVLVMLFTGCKKDKLPPNIIESSVDINNEQTIIEEIDQKDIFRPTSVYMSYFAAAAISIENQLIFIGTQSPYDHDMAYSDLQVKRTDLNFNEIGGQALFRSNDAKLNSITPALIRVGNLYQFYYLRQESANDAQIYLMESADGISWGNERRISLVEGFNGIINDRVQLLSTGRIIIPVSFTKSITSSYHEQYIFCYYSDDKGITWQKSQDLRSSIPLMEPSVAEYANGKLLMVIRSELGKLLFSRSLDNGLTWSAIEKSKINSPASTSALFKIDEGVLALIWNNTPPSVHVLDRKPLSLSLSRDEGLTWSIPYKIGDQDGEIYSSPGMFRNGDYWFVYFNYSAKAGEYGIRAKKIKIKY